MHIKKYWIISIIYRQIQLFELISKYGRLWNKYFKKRWKLEKSKIEGFTFGYYWSKWGRIQHIEPEAKVLTEHLKEENFLNDINEVNSIIAKLEKLENDKTLLKNQLKIIEDKFQSKKHQTEEKIKTMSKESEMLDKTITVIKNLKNF